MLGIRPYAPYEALVSQARAKSQIWRLFMGVILVSGVFLVGNQLLHQSVFTFLGPTGYGALTGLDGNTTQLSMVFLLLTFGLMTVGVIVALRVVHLRGIGSLLGDKVLFRQQFMVVVRLLILLNVVIFILPPWDLGEPLVPNVPPARWLVALPFALIAVMVQVSAEEIMFRGYLQQQLAARFSHPLVWIGIPALLFGVGHYVPDETGENAGLIAVWAVLFGVLMADLTARAGTLGPAIAVHFVNNVIAIVVISMPDSLSGLSLYLSPFSMEDTDAVRAWLPVDFAMMLVSWLAARVAIRR